MRMTNTYRKVASINEIWQDVKKGGKGQMYMIRKKTSLRTI